MPFLDIPVTRPMNAVKLYEYLAAGKPVVSRDLPEVRRLTANDPDAQDLIALYSTPREFFARLEAAVASGEPELVQRRKSFARRNNWGNRVDVLAREITRLSSAHDTSSINASSKGSKTRSQE
jgi:hypothetical protein